MSSLVTKDINVIDTFSVMYESINVYLLKIKEDFKAVNTEEELNIVIDEGMVDVKLPFVRCLLYNVKDKPQRNEYDYPLGHKIVKNDEIIYTGVNIPYNFYYQIDILTKYPREQKFLTERFLRYFPFGGGISTSLGMFYIELVDNITARDTISVGVTLEGFEVFRTTLRYIVNAYLVSEDKVTAKKATKTIVNVGGIK